jgi:hypothetical protein
MVGFGRIAPYWPEFIEAVRYGEKICKIFTAQGIM